MADEFVLATEKYGPGNIERKYRFSASNGTIERIGRKRGTISTSLKQFFVVSISLANVEMVEVLSPCQKWAFIYYHSFINPQFNI